MSLKRCGRRRKIASCLPKIDGLFDTIATRLMPSLQVADPNVISILQSLFCNLQYMRIPFMLMDGLVIYGLQQTENRIKKEKALAEKGDGVQHEETKKNTRAQKSAMRKQQKQTEKKVLQTSGKANFGGPAVNNRESKSDKSKKAL
jgi:hypothetical protein